MEAVKTGKCVRKSKGTVGGQQITWNTVQFPKLLQKKKRTSLSVGCDVLSDLLSW